MIIFQRMITFQAPPQDVTPWALEITEAVNERTDLNVSLWQGLFGVPAGTLVWSSLVENLTVIETAMATLSADSDIAELSSKGQAWSVAPPEDLLLRMVHSAGGEYVRPDVGAYAEGVRAQPAGGRLARAAGWGVEIADVHSRITHSSVLFCTSAYGGYGEMVWLAMYDSAAAVDRAAEAVAKDEDYLAKLDSAGDLFVDGSVRRLLSTRLA